MSSGVALATSTGLVRKQNEDSAYAGHWLCAVADGMGGHAAGDMATTPAVRHQVRQRAAALADTLRAGIKPAHPGTRNQLQSLA
jgi:protein phosphatase